MIVSIVYIRDSGGWIPPVMLAKILTDLFYSEIFLLVYIYIYIYNVLRLDDCLLSLNLEFIFTRGQFWPSGIVIACVCGSVCVCVYQSLACPGDNSTLIQARITKFWPEMQNTLVWVPIVLGDDRPWPSRSNLTSKSNFTPFWASPHHNSSPVQARITKFGPKMHLSTVKIPSNFGHDCFWSSLSFSILKPIYLPNLFALFLYYI